MSMSPKYNYGRVNAHAFYMHTNTHMHAHTHMHTHPRTHIHDDTRTQVDQLFCAHTIYDAIKKWNIGYIGNRVPEIKFRTNTN
jgi:hypothetical protein